MSGDEYKLKTIRGTVTRTQLGGTSKSRHEGFVLKNDDGNVKLRREGGSPFYDDFFEEYEGKKVTVKGYDMDSYFLVKDIDVKNK